MVITQVVGFTVQACPPRLYRDRRGSRLTSMQYSVARAAQALPPRVWQESDELLIYLQIATKYFRLMIRQYFISLTVNLEL